MSDFRKFLFGTTSQQAITTVVHYWEFEQKRRALVLQQYNYLPEARA